MVGSRLAVEFRDGLPLMSPPCRASLPQASGLADGSDGGFRGGRLGLGGELLASGLGWAGLKLGRCDEMVETNNCKYTRV